ncbi:apolipoprotein L3-like [Onychostoma macrolepis]|uniref:apolipoprotein L3-like n=1 Tax=Onychostoma macrolepis TaxID=369639 RepID=UPI00272BB299|nr:apolipoprotein L3-like [Onychostoma macrolepis]XP_058627136.1 apolipoprotein L3-like [Onychostoma macrolepis]XP_058627137.1 apolipoprotein L3-like [Onychostoma macrolepis]XP_058627138.1 apolipoprotein L3-like [Onychostoma macrolepis]XP_058627140.1 apolipoprotein L3-like [Onychostoma macrolepis]
MASSTHRRRRNSKDEPPDMLSDVIGLQEEFIALYERHYHELQECIQALNHLINTFEKDLRRCTAVTIGGGIVGIAGGVTTIAGLALAPFTLGASVAVAGVGSIMAFGGGVGSGLVNFMKMHQQKKLIQNVKNGLEEFQNKIKPMTDILNVICEHYNEILRHLNKPEDDIRGFIKCAAGASEILCFMRIDDIGEVAAQASKTVRLTTTLTGVFAGISLVFDILSVIEDNKTLDDLNKLSGNHQISESEMESKAGKFIVEMRKVIHQQQNFMDELKKTKDKFARRLALIRA